MWGEFSQSEIEHILNWKWRRIVLWRLWATLLIKITMKISEKYGARELLPTEQIIIAQFYFCADQEPLISAFGRHKKLSTCDNYQSVWQRFFVAMFFR